MRERSESARVALKELPILFSRAMKEKYAGLLETHKEEMARTGRLPDEILSEARKDAERQQKTGLKVGAATGAVITTLFGSPENIIFWTPTGGFIGSAAARVAKINKPLVRLKEKWAARKLSPEQTYERNLAILEKRIKQLRR